MITSLFESAITFKKYTLEKVAFIALCQFDLLLSLLALYLGFTEINPIMNYLFRIPEVLLLVKLVIPVLIAWLMPGRFLWPSIFLLAIVSFWNIKEILVFFL
jgi:hypothetical protein